MDLFFSFSLADEDKKNVIEGFSFYREGNESKERVGKEKKHGDSLSLIRDHLSIAIEESSWSKKLDSFSGSMRSRKRDEKKKKKGK